MTKSRPRLVRARRYEVPRINSTGVFALRNIERVTIHNGASSYGSNGYSQQIGLRTSCDKAIERRGYASDTLRSLHMTAARRAPGAWRTLHGAAIVKTEARKTRGFRTRQTARGAASHARRRHTPAVLVCIRGNVAAKTLVSAGSMGRRAPSRARCKTPRRRRTNDGRTNDGAERHASSRATARSHRRPNPGKRLNRTNMGWQSPQATRSRSSAARWGAPS